MEKKYIPDIIPDIFAQGTNSFREMVPFGVSHDLHKLVTNLPIPLSPVHLLQLYPLPTKLIPPKYSVGCRMEFNSTKSKFGNLYLNEKQDVVIRFKETCMRKLQTKFDNNLSI